MKDDNCDSPLFARSPIGGKRTSDGKARAVSTARPAAFKAFNMASPRETLSAKLREDPFLCEFSPSEQEILDVERKAHSKRARRVGELLRALHYCATSEPHRELAGAGMTEDQFWHSYGDRHSGYEIPKLEAELARRVNASSTAAAPR